MRQSQNIDIIKKNLVSIPNTITSLKNAKEFSQTPLESNKRYPSMTVLTQSGKWQSNRHVDFVSQALVCLYIFWYGTYFGSYRLVQITYLVGTYVLTYVPTFCSGCFELSKDFLDRQLPRQYRMEFDFLNCRYQLNNLFGLTSTPQQDFMDLRISFMGFTVVSLCSLRIQINQSIPRILNGIFLCQ